MKRYSIISFILLILITSLYNFNKNISNTENSINEVITTNNVSTSSYFIDILDSTSYVAHRGAVSNMPENSIIAFKTTKEMAYTIVETDLQLTKDGQWILMHDYTLERTTTGKGEVRDYTLAEIRSLKLKWDNSKVAEKDLFIPTLDEFLKICTELGLSPILDIKPNEKQISYRAYLNLINSCKKYNLINKTIICSYSKGVLSQIRKMQKNLTIAVMIDVTEDTLQFTKELENAFIYYNYKAMSEEKIKRIQEKGLKYGVWTIDSNEVAEYFKNKNSIMIVTDSLIPEEYNKTKLVKGEQ